MTKQDLQFAIDQLRKDKIIYGIESVAVSTIAIFVTPIFLTYLGKQTIIILTVITIFVVSYWGYCMLGNLFRLLKIRKLEALLQTKL